MIIVVPIVLILSFLVCRKAMLFDQPGHCALAQCLFVVGARKTLAGDNRLLFVCTIVKKIGHFFHLTIPQRGIERPFFIERTVSIMGMK